MSTGLELPPPRDLPPQRRREIRAALVRASHRRRHPRRWLVTAPVAVLTLLLGLGLGLTRPWDTGTPVVGVPAGSPTPSLEPAPGPTAPTPTPTPAFPAARATDGGALSASARTAVVRRCLADLGRSSTVETVHFARRTSTSGDVVLLSARDGLSYVCSKDRSGLYAGPGSKTKDLPAPDAEHPAVRVDGDGLGSGSDGDGHVSATTSAAYRVTDEVASLQSRLTVDGHTGPWFEASRADGWAWAGATLEYESSRRRPEVHPDYRIDVRAYDVSGKRLEVDRTPR